MSRTLDYQSLRADLHANAAATLVRDVSEATIRSLHVIPTAERRENLVALAVAFHKANAPKDLRPHVAQAVRYHALAADPMPAWGRLLVAVRENDAVEVDKALARLMGEVAAA